MDWTVYIGFVCFLVIVFALAQFAKDRRDRDIND